MGEITIAELAEALAAEQADRATVVDVRERDEYVAGRVPGVVSIPMGQLADRVHDLDRSRPLYVICASGNRSAAMTDFLTAAGFDARNVAGGTSAWIRAGRPVERG